MAEESITLERILQVYREESQRKALTPLEPEFWERVQRLVVGLEDDLKEESSHDPNSAKAALLRDELKKVLKRRDQIYQYRERKRALMAASAASGAAVDTTPLTPLEEESFKMLLDVLERGRRRAFGVEAGTESETANRGDIPPKDEGERKPKKSRRAKPKKDQVLVRILEDIPPFLGIDTTYELKKEDVISLPPQVAKILLDQGKAEVIKPRLETHK